MTETGATTPRERYRAQVRAEVKQRAWEQIATAGASALSLNAIAKQMGLSGPALYRYFAGRDELITELIRDAYRSLADAFRASAAAGTGVAGLAHTLRAWALDDPQRYFLVYGTPVPGYHAPDDITELASQIMTSLLDASAERRPTARRPRSPHSSRASAGSGRTATPPRPPPCAGPWPSGPGCTASCPWNSRATSRTWASTPPTSSPRS